MTEDENSGGPAAIDSGGSLGAEKSSSTTAVLGSEGTDTPQASASTPARQIAYLHGPRLYFLTLAIWICVFFANVEISIVSTSLVTITSDFQSFDQSSWIVSAYQITYTCFLVVWAKVGDIFGRKWALTSSVLFFALFSGACGAAQTMPQLIVLRAFQGLGASGAFSISSVIIYEMIPKEKLPVYGGLTFAIVALATVVGPLLGGAIDNNTTWRWIFLINVPVLVVALVLIYIVMPTKFPYHGPESSESKVIDPPSSAGSGLRSLVKRIDFIGAVLLLAAAFTLLTALLEASVDFSWSSATIIVLLVLSTLFWVTFFIWEWHLSRANTTQEPIFPWRFAQNRAWMGMLITALCLGVPMTVLSIILPQWFQAVNGDSPLKAGIRILAITVAIPLGSLAGNVISAAAKQPVIIFLFAGSVVELLGAGLLIMLPNTGAPQRAIYGFEFLTGFGAGVVFSLLMLITPRCVGPRDLAGGTSAIVMFRMIGGAIGVAISGSIVNGYITSQLSSLLSSSQLHMLQEDVSAVMRFSPAQQDGVKATLGLAYHASIYVIVGLAAAQILSVCLIWKRPQITAH